LPVKINRTRSKAKAGMRKKGDTSDRPEELLVYDIVRLCQIPGTRKVEKQYKPPNIVPLKGTDLTGEKSPKLDVYVQSADFTNYAIRVMGEYHDETKQERKDFIQKTFLEMQPENWFVIDLNYLKCQNVFKRRKRKLVTEELILAYNEIKKHLMMCGLNLLTPSDEIMQKLALSHCN